MLLNIFIVIATVFFLYISIRWGSRTGLDLSIKIFLILSFLLGVVVCVGHFGLLALV